MRRIFRIIGIKRTLIAITKFRNLFLKSNNFDIARITSQDINVCTTNMKKMTIKSISLFVFNCEASLLNII